MQKAELEAYRPMYIESEQVRMIISGLDKLQIQTEDVERQRESLRKKYEAQLSQLLEKMMRIEESVQSLQDPNERIVIRMRYIDGLQFQRIAQKMRYCERQTYRIHQLALDHLKKT